MYFGEALTIVAKRWLIVVVALLFIGVACGFALSIVPTRRQATAQVLLLPPAAQVDQNQRTNPYLNLPGALTFTATLVANGLMTLDEQRAFAEDGFLSTYVVSVIPQAGPLILISTQDTDAVAALALRDALIERVIDDLDQIQIAEGVPTSQLIAARQFNVSSQAEVLAGNRLRALAGIVTVGTVLTALVVFGVERRSAQRALRRRKKSVAQASVDDTPVALTDLEGSQHEPPPTDPAIDAEGVTTPPPGGTARPLEADDAGAANADEYASQRRGGTPDDSLSSAISSTGDLPNDSSQRATIRTPR